MYAKVILLIIEKMIKFKLITWIPYFLYLTKEKSYLGTTVEDNAPQGLYGTQNKYKKQLNNQRVLVWV